MCDSIKDKYICKNIFNYNLNDEDKNMSEVIIKREENIAKEPQIDDVVNMIDQMMNGGVGRLKVKTSDELKQDEIKKEYHHGRCDINSPWACGKAFDVLE